MIFNLIALHFFSIEGRNLQYKEGKSHGTDTHPIFRIKGVEEGCYSVLCEIWDKA
jgi:hypothetical protein